MKLKILGLPLDNKKRKINGINDLNKIDSSDINKVNKNPDLKTNMFELGFEVIDLEKVKNNSYNLVGNYYRETIKNTEIIRLSEVLETLESGNRPKGGIDNQKTEGAISLGGEQIGEDGKLNLSKIPFIDIDFYQIAKKGLVKNNDILMCKDGALTGKVCIIDTRTLLQKEVMVNEHVYIFRGKPNIIHQSYLFYCLYSNIVQNQIKNLAYNKSAQPGLNRENINSIYIPLPNLAEQRKIVEELNSYQKIIDGAKQIIDNWKPDFNTTKYKSIEVGNIATFEYGYTATAMSKGDCRFIRITDIDASGLIINNNCQYVNLSKEGNKFLLNKEYILVARTGATYGKTAIFASYLIRININKTLVLPKYYWYFAQSDYYWKQAKKLAGGTGQPQFNANVIQKIQIPLPSLLIQEEIIAELEHERNMIEANKETIKLFENKLKTKLNSLWQ